MAKGTADTMKCRRSGGSNITKRRRPFTVLTDQFYLDCAAVRQRDRKAQGYALTPIDSIGNIDIKSQKGTHPQCGPPADSLLDIRNDPAVL